MSSLHGAKGHEFGSVLIVGAVEGMIPQRGATDADSLAAEAALLYVGMTRARELLYLSYTTIDGNGKEAVPSSFSEPSWSLDEYERCLGDAWIKLLLEP